MLHVGNDIVDRKSPEAAGKSRDRRFLRKALTPLEQEAVAGAPDPDLALWSLWAAKEAAYKAVSKSFPDISAAPRRYCVTLAANDPAGGPGGVVQTPAGRVPVRVFRGRKYLHCIAVTAGPEDFETLDYSHAPIRPGRESEMVREMAIGRIASRLDIRPEAIRIVRRKNAGRPGPPLAVAGGRELDLDISLSHHGRFAAYAAWIAHPPAMY